MTMDLETREKTIKKIDKCGKQLKLLLSLAGVYSIHKPSLFIRFYWYFAVAIIAFNVVGIAGFIVHHRHNLNMVLSGTGIGISLSCVILKGACFHVYRGNVISINEKLERMMENQMTAEENVWRVLIKTMTYFTRNIYATIFTLGYMLLLLMLSRPTMIMLMSYAKGNTTFVRFYPSKYPWDVPPGSKIWGVHLFLDLVCSWFVVCIGVTADNLYAYLVSKIISHFQALNYEIENLEYNGMEKKKIQNYVERHLELNDICKLLGETTGPFILVVTMSTAVILCTTIFQFSQMKSISLSQISWPLAYTIYKLLQIFVYAWAGELIKHQSENFRQAVYASAWTDANSKLASHTVRMMMNQKPFVLNACGIKPISAELFSGLLNTTLSYFFLIQTISEKADSE